jgi:hypothetical protein
MGLDMLLYAVPRLSTTSWYYDDLRDTLSQLTHVLDTVDEADYTLVYRSSW